MPHDVCKIQHFNTVILAVHPTSCFVNMADWIPNCHNSPVFIMFKKYRNCKQPYKQSYSPIVMSRSLFIFILLTSAAVAYFASYLPRLLVILYPNQLSWSSMHSFPSPETSLVLRPKKKVIISKGIVIYI